jgi:hypothetical protein
MGQAAVKAKCGGPSTPPLDSRCSLGAPVGMTIVFGWVKNHSKGKYNCRAFDFARDDTFLGRLELFGGPLEEVEGLRGFGRD